jgi:hypothetical protein
LENISILEEADLNKWLKLGIVVVTVGGLMAGCGTFEAKDKEVKVKAAKENKSNPVSAAAISPKVWTDKSSANGLEKTDFTPNAKGWVADELNIFRQPPDPKLLQAGYDEGYDYYLKADAVSRVAGSDIRVEGVDLEKDFENLRVLSKIIVQEQDVRTAAIDTKKYEENKRDAIKEWKPMSKRMQSAYDYMTKLLNDLDVAINKDGKGETFGVSHQLDGDKVKEMESFISTHKE